MGWLCFHHQLDSSACLRLARSATLLTAPLRVLFRLLHSRLDSVHANTIRWLSTGTHK